MSSIEQVSEERASVRSDLTRISQTRKCIGAENLE